MSIYFSRLLGVKFKNSAHFTENIPATIIASCVFILFLKLSPFKYKIINILAIVSFAVFLITEQIVFRKILWTKIINANAYQNSPYLYLFAISTVIIIYVICLLFDFVISYVLLRLRRHV